MLQTGVRDSRHIRYDLDHRMYPRLRSSTEVAVTRDNIVTPPPIVETTN
jgi:hypothetical protein